MITPLVALSMSFILHLSMIVFDEICTTAQLYTIAICIDGAIMNVWPCLLWVPICVVCHWPGVFYY